MTGRWIAWMRTDNEYPTQIPYIEKRQKLTKPNGIYERLLWRKYSVQQTVLKEGSCNHSSNSRRTPAPTPSLHQKFKIQLHRMEIVFFFSYAVSWARQSTRFLNTLAMTHQNAQSQIIRRIDVPSRNFDSKLWRSHRAGVFSSKRILWKLSSYRVGRWGSEQGNVNIYIRHCAHLINSKWATKQNVNSGTEFRYFREGFGKWVHHEARNACMLTRKEHTKM